MARERPALTSGTGVTSRLPAAMPRRGAGRAALAGATRTSSQSSRSRLRSASGGSRSHHRDLVVQRRGAQERERSRVRAGERRVRQIGKDEEDAHVRVASSRAVRTRRRVRWYHSGLLRVAPLVGARMPQSPSRSMLNAASGVTMYGVFSSLRTRERRGVVATSRRRRVPAGR